MIELFFVAAAFVVSAMAFTLLVWRDSRPRVDDWRTIVRRIDSPQIERHDHDRRYCRKEHDDERLGPGR